MLTRLTKWKSTTANKPLSFYPTTTQGDLYDKSRTKSNTKSCRSGLEDLGKHTRRISTRPCKITSMAESSPVQLYFSCAVSPVNKHWQAHSSSNTKLSLTKTTFGIAGIPVVILMVCAAFPLPAMQPEGPRVNLLHLSCTFRASPSCARAGWTGKSCTFVKYIHSSWCEFRWRCISNKQEKISWIWPKHTCISPARCFPQLFTDTSNINRDISEAKC